MVFSSVSDSKPGFYQTTNRFSPANLASRISEALINVSANRASFLDQIKNTKGQAQKRLGPPLENKFTLQK
jgi:hypothetical protein